MLRFAYKNVLETTLFPGRFIYILLFVPVTTYISGQTTLQKRNVPEDATKPGQTSTLKENVLKSATKPG